MSEISAAGTRFERRTLSGDKVSLFWFDYGAPDGKPLALVHGLGAGADQFDADARWFASNGYRVIVPDLRGHGRSGKSASGDYTIARMARDLLEIFDDAGLGVVDYVGNSLGGILALYLVKDHASRFRTLTIFGTAPALNLPRFASTLIPWGYRLVGKARLSRLSARTTTRSPEGRVVLETLLTDFDPEVGRIAGAEVGKYDLTANAMGFTRPFLIIRGADDKAVNRALDPKLKAFEQKANVRLVRMDGAGHCANLDQPHAFRETVLDFIAPEK